MLSDLWLCLPQGYKLFPDEGSNPEKFLQFRFRGTGRVGQCCLTQRPTICELPVG